MPEDEDEARAAEWANAAPTVADSSAVPVLIEPNTPRPETTGRHRLTPALFANGVELADRDGYARGLEHGRAQGRAEGEAAAMDELRRIREDVIDTMRAMFVIFEIKMPDWETAEAWIRRRLTPL